MKKRLVVLVALLAVAIFVFASCAETPASALDILREKYEEVSTAKSIEQKIEITQGKRVQFESNKTFTKTDTGYSVTGEEKRVNESLSDSDEMYNVTKVEESLTASEKFLPNLELKEEYFVSGYRLTETSLSATVVAGREKELLSLADVEVTAPVTNMTIQLSVEGEHLKSVAINYTSNGSSVAIELTFVF